MSARDSAWSARSVEYFSAAGPDGDLAATPDPGRVDQHDLAATPRQAGVDGVAGRARDLRDDRPVLAEQRVEQARLADVRPPDEGDRGGLVGVGGHRGIPVGRFGIDAVEVGRLGAIGAVGVAGLGIADDERVEMAGRDLLGPRLGLFLARLACELDLALGRQRPDDRVEQVAGAAAVRRRDRVGLLPAELVELGAFELALLVVGLVDDDDHRRGRPAQDARRLEVGRGQPGHRVDHEQDRRRPRRSPGGPAPGRGPRSDRRDRARDRRCRRRRSAGRSTRCRRRGGHASCARGPRRSPCAGRGSG